MTTTAPTTSRLLVLDPGDDVAVAMGALYAGDLIDTPQGPLTIGSDVPQGHKIALRDLAEGEHVHKYGQSIGVASTPIPAGGHVHSHNLGYVDEGVQYEIATEHATLSTQQAGRTFDGYLRADGKVGTRNYIGILASVNCSASTAKMIAAQAEKYLGEFPGVDGVVALTHSSGCGMIPTSVGGSTLQRTLHGYAAHPNFSGLLLLGLGCEMVQVKSILDTAPIPSDTVVRTLTIQDTGGIRATVAAGVEAIRAMLPELATRTRTPQPISTLVLGLNCGGSDGYSGITANPALGYASDLLVGAGGTSVLAEVPEVMGAEQLLLRRAVSQQVGDTLLERLDWWRGYAAAGGGSLDNNPSPGNKAGGLTTILEKSLGAVAKAGRADLSAVIEYAEPIPQGGLVLMDTPGYDPVSVTGLIGGGANVIVFTTGRGSVIGARPSPVIKVATNTEMYTRMADDMDINAGRIADGTASLEQIGREIFEQIIAVASGSVRTVSEELGLGQEEFVPWQLGAVT
ncbi:MAG TPA: altronate dehydratase family protein [Micropruina sp.]|nr:altronate dehydratase family protein [Micropruina sp.]